MLNFLIIVYVIIDIVKTVIIVNIVSVSVSVTV